MPNAPRILICLTATNMWYGKLVRWATRSNVNHSLIKHEDPFWGDWRATEINEDGPHDQDIRKLTRIDYIEHWESDIDLLPGMRSMRRFVGTAKYDWFGLLFGLVRAILSRLFGWNVEEAIHTHGRLFCSEFIAEVFKRSNVPGVQEWNTANISPGDLREFMELSSHFELVEDPSCDPSP